MLSERRCPDCGKDTLFFPVDAEAWVCTECDGALAAPVVAA